MPVRLRPAERDDAYDVAKVHVRAWQVGYRSLLPADALAGLRPEERAARYTFGDPHPLRPFTTLALVDDVIVGFVTTGPASERTDGAGHLMALYVEPARWGQGLGRTLLAAGRERLAAAGFDAAALWVLEGNARAERVYAADGWQADGPVEPYTLWGIALSHRRWRRALP